MKPVPFSYVAPTDLAEAIAQLERLGEDAKVISGGQSLMPLLNLRLAQPSALVDIGRIKDLRGISSNAGTIRTGATTTQASCLADPMTLRRLPVLAEALAHVAHPQIRNRGTVGGSIAHADPAAELPTLAVGLGATMHIEGPEGPRSLPAASFFAGMFTTELQPNEILVAIDWPIPGATSGTGFREIAHRHGDFALAGAFAMLELGEDARCVHARCVLMSAGEVPIQIDHVEDILIGVRPEQAPLQAVAHQAMRQIRPAGDGHASTETRQHLALAATEDALSIAARRATATIGGQR